MPVMGFCRGSGWTPLRAGVAVLETGAPGIDAPGVIPSEGPTATGVAALGSASGCQALLPLKWRIINWSEMMMHFHP